MVVPILPFQNKMVGNRAKMRGKYTNGRDFDLRSGENDEFCLEYSGKPSELDFFVLRMIKAPFTIRKNLL